MCSPWNNHCMWHVHAQLGKVWGTSGIQIRVPTCEKNLGHLYKRLQMSDPLPAEWLHLGIHTGWWHYTHSTVLVRSQAMNYTSTTSSACHFFSINCRWQESFNCCSNRKHLQWSSGQPTPGLPLNTWILQLCLWWQLLGSNLDFPWYQRRSCRARSSSGYTDAVGICTNSFKEILVSMWNNGRCVFWPDLAWAVVCFTGCMWLGFNELLL